MPTIAPLQLATLLEKYKRENRLSILELSGHIGIGNMALYGFLRKHRTPQHDNLEKITQFMQDQGILSRLQLPKEMAVASPADVSALKEIGFENTTPKGRHYVCGYLEDLEFAYFVQAIMNSAMPTEMKTKLLGALSAQSFPTLS